MRNNPHHAILSGKLLHPRKAKRYSFHPYRLTFIFSQHRRHGCHRAFSLPESVHGIISPVWIDSHHTSLFWKLLHLMQNKSGRDSPEFVHRIAPPVQTILTSQTYPKICCISRKTKRYSFHPYRLMFIFCQHRRHGCHRAFSLPEFVHRIALPVQIHEK